MRKKLLLVLCCSVFMLGMSGAAWALNLYGNNATFGSPYVYVMNPVTMTVTDEITNLSGSNGRGVVVVGDTMYYTTATSPSVYSYTLSTHTDNGALFTVAGASALSTMAYDGTNFWIGDYSGTNQAYLYTPTGTLIKTISLSNCSGHCDGLEYFVQNSQGRLISNRGDTVGPYDIYDTDGNLLTPSFINPTFASTGIAFDGTNFYVSEIYNGKIAEYDGTTGTFINETAINGYNNRPLVEDLSFDYVSVLPPPTAVPEPSTMLLMGVALAGGAGFMRKRRVAKG